MTMTAETTETPALTAARSARNKTITRLLIGITLLGVALFTTCVVLVVYLSKNLDTAEVKEESFLAIHLNGVIPDAPAVGGFVLDPADVPLIVTDIADGIRGAATDDRINGIFLELNEPAMGWAGVQEVRTALEDFRAAGKPCVTYSQNFSNASYYLGSVCDKVVLAPSGVALFIGLHAEYTYYAGMFEKLGIEAEMLHVGDFKSAIEPYERTEPSESASEAMNYLLDGLFTEMLTSIAASRGVTEADVRAWIDTPSLVPEEALKRGMVDVLAFGDAVRGVAHEVGEPGWVESLAGASSDEADLPSLTPFREYLKDVRKDLAEGDAKVAVVYAEGAIMPGQSSNGLFGSTGLTDGAFRSWMVDARTNDDVKAVVVRINSPGGSGLASDMMWREMELTKKAGKPVVISMGNLAASGGYFLSAPANWIVAQPSTITGSIGVFGGKIDISGTDEWTGLNSYSYKRGAHSDLFSARAGFEGESREVFQGYLDGFYTVFVNKVATGRSLAYEQVHEVAQGRVWTGRQALERQLVDEIGGLDVAIKKAAELAALGDEFGRVRLPAEKDFFELLMEDLAEVRTVDVQLPEAVEAIAAPADDLLLLQAIFEAGDIAAMMPGRLTVE
jgi:protease IV